MWLRHRNARQPLDAICVMACSTIADGSGISASSTPIRIRPPAIPNSPDRNAVATISRPSAAIISAVIRISAAMLSPLPRRSKLSYLGLASALLRVSENAAAAVSQRNEGVRGRRAQWKLRRRRRRTQRLRGRNQPAGAIAGAAARGSPVRTQGQPAGADRGGPRLPERVDADLRRVGEPDRA